MSELLTHSSPLWLHLLKKSADGEWKQSMLWQPFAACKKANIHITWNLLHQISSFNEVWHHHLSLKLRVFQTLSQSNFNLLNVFSALVRKGYQQWNIYNLSSAVTTWKSTFIINIFIIIQMIIWSHVLIWGAMSTWPAQCICRVMQNWFTRCSLDCHSAFSHRLIIPIQLEATTHLKTIMKTLSHWMVSVWHHALLVSYLAVLMVMFLWGISHSISIIILVFYGFFAFGSSYSWKLHQNVLTDMSWMTGDHLSERKGRNEICKLKGSQWMTLQLSTYIILFSLHSLPWDLSFIFLN